MPAAASPPTRLKKGSMNRSGYAVNAQGSTMTNRQKNALYRLTSSYNVTSAMLSAQKARTLAFAEEGSEGDQCFGIEIAKQGMSAGLTTLPPPLLAGGQEQRDQTQKTAKTMAATKQARSRKANKAQVTVTHHFTLNIPHHHLTRPHPR